MGTKIWIDITNSPHVLFFAPLIQALKRHTIVVTARDYQQTVPLLKQKEIPFTLVGKHYGKSKLRKAIGLFRRTSALKRYLNPIKNEIAFSISHGSPYCSRASKGLGIYNMWTLDGDKARTIIRQSVPHADRVIIPSIVPKANYVQLGAKEETIMQYPGLKEEVYLWNFQPNSNYLADLNMHVEPSRPAVLIRPEAAEADYIRETAYFFPIVNQLIKDYSIIVLPRTPRQEAEYRQYFAKTPVSIIDCRQPLDGPNLIANIDLIIGGGGTMNREAVVLGKKVISTFREAMLTIDTWLVNNQYMLHDPEPSKAVIDQYLNNEIQTLKYKRSRRTFDFFRELMTHEGYAHHRR